MLLLAALLGCAPATTPPPDPPEIELAVLMLRFQTHASKLWFSGAANNWPLAGFYVKELGETYNEIREGKVEHDGHDISAIIQEVLEPDLKRVRAAVVSGDRAGFEVAYDAMLGQCNACHARTGHPYIQLQRPAAPDYTNQRFDPAPGAPSTPSLPHDENSPFDND
jgi:hypothetical protein